MKQPLIATLFCSLLFYCALAQGGEPLVRKWQIDKATATRMTGEQQDCDTCRFKGWSSSDTVKETKRQLRESLGIARINFRKNWMAGRYNAADEARYAKNHGLAPGSPAALVSGYTNRILRYRLPKKVRAKYTSLSQKNNSQQVPIGRQWLIGTQLLPLLQKFKKDNRPLPEEKFIYLDFAQLCPPPHGC